MQVIILNDIKCYQFDNVLLFVFYGYSYKHLRQKLAKHSKISTLNTFMKEYLGYSLVDITNTGIIRDSVNPKARNQQRNWETLVQCLSLRTQAHNIRTPEMATINLDDFALSGDLFGEMYTGQANVWLFSWQIESDGIYDTDVPMSLLLKDFEDVPICTFLDETARFILPIFHPYGAIKNIHFCSL